MDSCIRMPISRMPHPIHRSHPLNNISWAAFNLVLAFVNGKSFCCGSWFLNSLAGIAAVVTGMVSLDGELLQLFGV